MSIKDYPTFDGPQSLWTSEQDRMLQKQLRNLGNEDLFKSPGLSGYIPAVSELASIGSELYGQYQQNQDTLNSINNQLADFSNVNSNAAILNLDPTGNVEFQDNRRSDAERFTGFLGGAAKGAMAGAALGPIGIGVGALIGGGADLVKGIMEDSGHRKAVDAANAVRNQNVNNFYNQVGVNDAMSKRNEMFNVFADGGDMQGLNGVNMFNTGGSHEENALNGIPQGYSNDGKQNLVEEGEVRFEFPDTGYIFSDRNALDASYLKNNNLPAKYAGRTPAYIAKKLQKDSEDRPNDAISLNTLNANMSRLRDAQEQYNADEQAKVMRNIFDSMSPEQQQSVIQSALQGQQQQYNVQTPFDQQVPQQQDMMQQEEQMLSNVFAKGGATDNTDSDNENDVDWNKERLSDTRNRIEKFVKTNNLTMCEAGTNWFNLFDKDGKRVATVEGRTGVLFDTENKPYSVLDENGNTVELSDSAKKFANLMGTNPLKTKKERKRFRKFANMEFPSPFTGENERVIYRIANDTLNSYDFLYNQEPLETIDSTLDDASSYMPSLDLKTITPTWYEQAGLEGGSETPYDTGGLNDYMYDYFIDNNLIYFMDGVQGGNTVSSGIGEFVRNVTDEEFDAFTQVLLNAPEEQKSRYVDEYKRITGGKFEGMSDDDIIKVARNNKPGVGQLTPRKYHDTTLYYYKDENGDWQEMSHLPDGFKEVLGSPVYYNTIRGNRYTKKLVRKIDPNVEQENNVESDNQVNGVEPNDRLGVDTLSNDSQSDNVGIKLNNNIGTNRDKEKKNKIDIPRQSEFTKAPMLAGLIGMGIGMMPADMTKANQLAANANILRNYSAPHIGGYQRYNPINQESMRNMVNANYAGLASLGVNRADRNAALAGLSALSQQQQAALYQNTANAEQMNQARRGEVARFNNAIDSANLSADLSAMQQNAAIDRSRVDQMNRVADAASEAKDARRQSMYKGIEALLTNAGKYGRYQDDLSMRDWLIKSGYYNSINK